MTNAVTSRQDLINELTPIFRSVFDEPNLVLKDEMTAADVAEWDSLNHINLIIAAEKRFSVKFLTAEIAGLANVGEFIDTVWKKIQAR